MMSNYHEPGLDDDQVVRLCDLAKLPAWSVEHGMGPTTLGRFIKIGVLNLDQRLRSELTKIQAEHGDAAAAAWLRHEHDHQAKQHLS
jgi:hypothetical protein